MLEIPAPGVDVGHPARFAIAGHHFVDGLANILLLGIRKPVRRQRVAVLGHSEADQGAIERFLDMLPRFLDVGEQIFTAILGQHGHAFTFEGDSRRI